jgi:protein TonB
MRLVLALSALLVPVAVFAAESPAPSKRAVPEYIGPAAVYPDRAQQARVSGTVALRVTTDEGGFVKNVRVSRETPEGYGFGDAAVKAVRRWKFQGQSRLNTDFDYTMNFTPK